MLISLLSAIPLAAGEDAGWRDKVVVIPISGAIMPAPLSELPAKVEEALDRAGKDGAKAVVLEVDSPGGETGACDNLSKKIFESKVPVTALVTHRAISGAAMISAAAPEIVMAEVARIGDIQPMRSNVVTGEVIAMDERTAEKIETDIRKILDVYAAKYGRPSAVFDSMVSRKYTLYRVVFSNDSTKFLKKEEMDLYEENLKMGRETLAIKSSQLVKSAGDLLMLTADQAVEYGVAKEKVADAESFYEKRGYAAEDIIRVDVPKGDMDLKKLIPKWEDFGLPMPVLLLLGVFLVIGVAGALTEAYSPGFGIPGAASIIGFSCFFITLMMYGRGSVVGMVIFMVGLALLIVEIVVLPGFGLAGILGIVGVILGLIAAFLPPWDSDYLQANLWGELGTFSGLMLFCIASVALLLWLVTDYGQKLPFIGRLALGRSLTPGDELRQAVKADEEVDREKSRLSALVGKCGRAETMLRPSGKVFLDNGERVDVTADTLFLDAGTRVEIVSAIPGRIVVAPVDADRPETPGLS